MAGCGDVCAQVIADTHGRNIRIQEDADMYILLGDNGGGWLHDLAYVSKRDNKPVVAVLGNHDDPMFPKWYPSFVHERHVSLFGYRFACIDGCLKKDGGKYIGYAEEEYRAMIENTAESDIILSHAPPYGLYEARDTAHTGIRALRDKIIRDRPFLCLYGHMHVRRTDCIGDTKVQGIYMSETVVLSREAKEKTVRKVNIQ